MINWKKYFVMGLLMKGLFFVLIFFQVNSIEEILGSSIFTSLEETEFRNWITEHGKKYDTKEAYLQRLKIFNENKQIIKELNLKKEKFGSDVEFATNKFADMSQQEFRENVLMSKRKPKTAFSSRSKESDIFHASLPESFDWKSKNILGGVRDQGDAGTCWAFSAVQTIETQWTMKTGKIVELSVEQVVDCDGTHDEKHADCGVFGGWPYLAYDYIKKAGGIQKEEDYSYCCGLGGDKGTCYVCPATGYNKTLCGPPVEYCKAEDSCSAKLNPSLFVQGLKVEDWSYINENETEMGKALIERGPLSVLINAETLQFYKRGVWDPIFCDPTSLDHAVLLTGFGSLKTVLQDKDYWIVKNSWGEKWGEDGYFRMARNKGKCGINKQVTIVKLAND